MHRNLVPGLRPLNSPDSNASQFPVPCLSTEWEHCFALRRRDENGRIVGFSLTNAHPSLTRSHTAEANDMFKELERYDIKDGPLGSNDLRALPIAQV
jgi:hypothetical protein